jgi:hypothetical protein
VRSGEVENPVDVSGERGVCARRGGRLAAGRARGEGSGGVVRAGAARGARRGAARCGGVFARRRAEA